ncbi:MAG TPA: transporter substrate-binding domain-containing protein, partial [Ignavibacteriaceae bacterium]|nr:transporter substrate-binding domain-containing protein [Ignavibacteriaceae bacterium]
MKKQILLFISFALFISGCGDSKKTITKLEDIKGVSIGAMTGSTGEQLALTRFPEATTKSFDDIMDGIAALLSGQIDAVITGYPAALNVCKHNHNLMILKEPVDYENTAIAVRKGNEELLDSVNELITRLRENGVLGDMKGRWMKTDLSPYVEADIDLPKEGKVLRIGTSATREPFCFVDKNQKVTGHDGELALRIAAGLNRPVEFFDMKFSALIPALQSGKVDLIIAGMTATEERAKSVNFTQSYFQNSQVIIVKRSEEEIELKSIQTKKKSIDDYKNKRIGVLIGSTHDLYAKENLPDAQILQYKTPPEILLAVKTGKVDAAMYNTESLYEIVRNDKELEIAGDTIFSVPVG